MTGPLGYAAGSTGSGATSHVEGLPELLTVKQVASRLSVSTPTVYSLIRSGDLVAIIFDTRIGKVRTTKDGKELPPRNGVVRVAEEDLRAFMVGHWGRAAGR